MSNLGNFVWGIADQLRGVYRPSQYGNVVLPMTILRRLDCILGPTRKEVRALAETETRPEILDVKVRRQFGLHFYNTSEYDLARLKKEPDGIRNNLIDYISKFSANVDVFERFKFENEIATLEENNRLYIVVQQFADIDLHPDVVSNAEMGDLFEELIGPNFNTIAVDDDYSRDVPEVSVGFSECRREHLRGGVRLHAGVTRHPDERRRIFANSPRPVTGRVKATGAARPLHLNDGHASRRHKENVDLASPTALHDVNIRQRQPADTAQCSDNTYLAGRVEWGRAENEHEPSCPTGRGTVPAIEQSDGGLPDPAPGGPFAPGGTWSEHVTFPQVRRGAREMRGYPCGKRGVGTCSGRPLTSRYALS